MSQVFITGASGFIGSSLAAELARRGHRVLALVRADSKAKLPPGCEAIVGDALCSESYAHAIAPANTFVHLVGVSHPNPKKAAEFLSIDLKSCKEAVRAAGQAGVKHFVYLSVARPAPIMREYQAARAAGEKMIKESGMAATFVRPWYVLGPGRRWPLLLVPLYAIAKVIPATRDGAERLCLVTLLQITQAIAWAVENPPHGVRVLEPREIRTGPASWSRPRHQPA